METVKQDATINETPASEKTFTQAELDAIVTERLSREKKKYEGFDELREKAKKFDEIEEANKSELEKATERAKALEAELDGMKKAETLRTMRESVAKELNVPASLLHGEDEDSCKEEAKAILEFAKSNGYPVVRDGGEVTNTTKPSTRQQFASWWDEATK